MYSDSDFERLYIAYMAEAMPRGVSIQAYCKNNNVPFNLFDKWYTDTRHKIEPVTVKDDPTQEPVSQPGLPRESKTGSVRIMVDIRMTNGLHIQQRNLSYRELVRLVGNLEGLC